MCECCPYPRELQSGLHPKLGLEILAELHIQVPSQYELQNQNWIRRLVSKMVWELSTYRGDNQFIKKRQESLSNSNAARSLTFNIIVIFIKWSILIEFKPPPTHSGSSEGGIFRSCRTLKINNITFRTMKKKSSHKARRSYTTYTITVCALNYESDEYNKGFSLMYLNNILLMHAIVDLFHNRHMKHYCRITHCTRSIGHNPWNAH